MHPDELREVSSVAEFNDLVALAAKICETPMAVITILDGGRVWAKARFGIPSIEMAEEQSFCVHLSLQGGNILEVGDTHLDERFSQLKIVTDEPKLRFCAGAHLRTPTGHILGGICVLDTQTRQLDADQRRCLQILGRQVMGQFELHRQNRDLRELQQKGDQMLDDLKSSEERFQLAMTGYPRGLWDLQVATGEMVYSPGFCRSGHEV